MAFIRFAERLDDPAIQYERAHHHREHRQIHEASLQ